MSALKGIYKVNHTPVAGGVIRAYRHDTGAMVGSAVSVPYSAAVPGDPNFSQVSMLILADSANGSSLVRDYAKGMVLNLNSNTFVTTPAKYNPTSMAFSGSNQTQTAYIPRLGTGTWTWEAWVYRTSTSQMALFDCGSNINSSGSLGMFIESGVLRVRIDGGNDTTSYTWGSELNNVWVHVAASRDSSGNIHVFINGTKVNTTSGRTQSVTARNVNLGFLASYGYYWQGYMDGIRFTADCRYTSNFTPPAGRYATEADDPYWDKTFMLFECPTVTGATTLRSLCPRMLSGSNPMVVNTSQKPYGDGSLDSNPGGGTSFAQFNNEPEFTFGTGDFTIQAWVYLNTVSEYMVVYDGRPASTQGFYPVLYINIDRTLRWYRNSADGIVGAAIPLTTWTHIAAVRASGVLKLYIDGVQTGSSLTDTSNYINGGAGRPMINGAADFNGTHNVNGFLAQVKASLYAEYTSTFTPPSANFPKSVDVPEKLLGSFEVNTSGYTGQCYAVALKSGQKAQIWNNLTPV